MFLFYYAREIWLIINKTEYNTNKISGLIVITAITAVFISNIEKHEKEFSGFPLMN